MKLNDVSFAIADFFEGLFSRDARRRYLRALERIEDGRDPKKGVM